MPVGRSLVMKSGKRVPLRVKFVFVSSLSGEAAPFVLRPTGIACVVSSGKLITLAGGSVFQPSSFGEAPRLAKQREVFARRAHSYLNQTLTLC